MPRIKYEDWKPKADALAVIRQADEIARSYRQQGYDLTLRQLYYQFVARALIPNTERSYKRLGSIVNQARMAGLLDWSYIVDRTRNLAGVGYFETPDELVRGLADYYSVDHWADQDTYVEVWVEKEALAGVVQRAARTWGVPYFSCRGYVSQSELWGAGQRLGQKIEDGKRVLVLHLGDHDPSGIDMTRDIRDRLRTFTTQDFLNAHADIWTPPATVKVSDIEREMKRKVGLSAVGIEDAIEVRRIALNMDQVDEYDPPPNPAKLTDSRVDGYIDRFGESSWELDALEPSVLDDLIQENIQGTIDFERWEVHDESERQERARLQYVADRWESLAEEYDSTQGEK